MILTMTITMPVTAMLHFGPALLGAAAFMAPPIEDYLRILPELVLSIFGMIIMVVDPLLDPERNQKPLGAIALVGTLAALASERAASGTARLGRGSG